MSKVKLRLVLSGGQTGADQTGVEEASRLGYETGGTTTKGCRTDEGPNPEWCKKYGLIEHYDEGYPPRTRQNAHDGDVTVWFGSTDSPGFYCTKKACYDWMKPLIINPSEAQIKELLEKYEVWNIAGNRKRKNPKVEGLVKEAFKHIPPKETKS